MTSLSLRLSGADKLLSQTKKDYAFYSFLTVGSLSVDDESHEALRRKVIDGVAALESALFVPELLTGCRLLDAESVNILREFMIFAAFDAKDLIGDEEVKRLQGRHAKIVARQKELQEEMDRKAFAQSIKSA